MIPIKRPWMNTLYRGQGAVSDLPCGIQEGVVVSEWELTDEERAAIAAGENVALFIYSEPIPPVALALINEEGTVRVDLRQYVSDDPAVEPVFDGSAEEV